MEDTTLSENSIKSTDFWADMLVQSVVDNTIESISNNDLNQNQKAELKDISNLLTLKKQIPESTQILKSKTNLNFERTNQLEIKSQIRIEELDTLVQESILDQNFDRAERLLNKQAKIKLALAELAEQKAIDLKQQAQEYMERINILRISKTEISNLLSFKDNRTISEQA